MKFFLRNTLTAKNWPAPTKELQKALVDFYSNAKAIIGNDKDTAEEIFLLNLQLFKPTFK